MEVPLPLAPLVRVVAQVRFPVVASVERKEFIAPFQEAIRSDYPVLRSEVGKGVVIGPEGVQEVRTATTWRFHDASQNWRVSLAPDFLAIETLRYTSRDDFMARLGQVLQALVVYVRPGVMDRLGVRYVDRVTDEAALSEMCRLVRPEVCGVMSTPLSGFVRHALSEQLFDLPEQAGFVLARWGVLPAGATHDPALVEPIDGRSWILDVDAYQAFGVGGGPLDVGEAVARARSLAERVYAVFRWAVTDEFLRRFGGEP